MMCVCIYICVDRHSIDSKYKCTMYIYILVYIYNVYIYIHSGRLVRHQCKCVCVFSWRCFGGRFGGRGFGGGLITFTRLRFCCAIQAGHATLQASFQGRNATLQVSGQVGNATLQVSFQGGNATL